MRLWSSPPAPMLGLRLMQLANDPVQPQVWGVHALLLATADSIAARFGAVTVRGEVSGFTRAASGHCYFSLKDADGASALVRCAMFRRAATTLDFDPRDNQQVELRGRLAVYEPRGELQMVVEAMRRVGVGSLYEEFLRLKAKLEAQGLFDAERKRPLVRQPRALGVITSLGAAALHDVLSALQRRAPHVRVVLYPSLVQGAEAPAALVAAIGLANLRAEVQTLLLVRGGGSLEDLWAFNDERVVRAVAASVLPVVCGVGHETDISLCDLAADLRAPTPTAAAELATPSRDEMLQGLRNQQRRADHAVQRQLQTAAQKLDRLALRLGGPAAQLAEQQQQVKALAQRLQRAVLSQQPRQATVLQGLATRLRRASVTALAARTQRLQALGQALGSLSPQQVLKRGYAWVEGEGGRPLVSATQVQPGQLMRAVWADGRAEARVEAVQVLPPA